MVLPPPVAGVVGESTATGGVIAIKSQLIHKLKALSSSSGPLIGRISDQKRLNSNEKAPCTWPIRLAALDQYKNIRTKWLIGKSRGTPQMVGCKIAKIRLVQVKR